MFYQTWSARPASRSPAKRGLSERSIIGWSFSVGMNRVVPLKQHLAAFDPNGPLLCLRNLDASRIMSCIQYRSASEPRRRLCVADKPQHRFVVLERLALPVSTDSAEQAMLNGIPLRCPPRIMADRNGHAPTIGHLLQSPFPCTH